jgi:hypothetical protein
LSSECKRLAVGRRLRLAFLHQSADVHRGVLANDDVFAAGAEGVAAFDGDQVVAGTADNFHAAHHSPAVEIAIVQLVFFDDVVVEQAEIVVGQELAGEEARAAKTLQASAGRARAHARIGAGRRRGGHAVGTVGESRAHGFVLLFERDVITK